MLAGVARWIGFLTMAVGATAVLLLAAGFGLFVSHIAGEEVSLDNKADGIVALTGAAARIPDAIELLATERGKRLLITGVHRDTSAREIARLDDFVQVAQITLAVPADYRLRLGIRKGTGGRITRR